MFLEANRDIEKFTLGVGGIMSTELMAFCQGGRGKCEVKGGDGL